MSLIFILTTKLKQQTFKLGWWLLIITASFLPNTASATVYSPGATLEPDCPPTESSATCGVTAPATADANTNITSLGGLTTALSAGQGGTGFSSYTAGDLLYALNSGALTKLGVGSDGQVLKVSGGVPIWGTSASANIGDTNLTLSGARTLGFGGYSLTFDGSTGDIVFGDNGNITIGGALAVTGTSTLTGNLITPKGTDYATTGSQNDVNLGTGSLFRYTGGGSATFTGIAGGVDGKQIRIMNVSGSNLVLNNQDTNSVAANRIITSSGANLTIPDAVSVGLQYDGGASRWRVVVLPATSGTINTFAFVQSGNAFGTTASLGTTDANGLNLITAGNTRFSLAAGAATLTGTGATILNTDAGSALTIDSGTTGALNFGSGANAKTITIGNTTGATALNLNAGTGGITLVGSTTLQNFTATNSTTTNATSTNLAVINNSQLGTITSGTWNGTAIGPTYGGTNQTSYTTGDILYASGANTLTKLPIGTAGQILNVSGGVPAWIANPNATINGKWATSTDNLSTYTVTAGQVVIVGRSSTTTTGNMLEVEGNSLFTGNANITGNLQLGTITSGTWNGTAIGPTYGGTNQTSYTTGDILYASGANTLTKLPIGGSGTVLTTVGGVPTWAAPTGGSGATINGKWATSTDSLTTYTISPIEAVVVGASATTSLGRSLNAKLEVVGNTLFGGNVNTTGLTTFSGGFISSASSTISTLNVSGMLGASTTLQSTGAARFYSTGQFDNTLTAAGSGTGLAVSNNATVGGTLGITGLTTLGNASSTLLSASSGLFVGGNATTSSNGNFSTAGTITAAGLLTASNGLTLSSGTLTLPATSIADAALSSNVGLLSGTQTFSGAKTFSALATFSNASTTQLSVSDALYVAGNLITPKGTDYATTGTQNDVNLGTGSLFRYTGGGSATFTGIAGGVDGKQIRIMNVSGSSLILSNESASSVAANRIITTSGSDLTIPNNISIGLQYDSGASRWRVVVLPATSGTINGFAFIQSGNAFGTTASLGTTDANGLNLITAGNTRFSLAAGAATLTGSGATSLVGGSTLALSSAAGSDLSITSGTTGALGLDSGSTGAINLGTGSNAKTITIGNGTGATSLVLNAGTGNIDIGANAVARTINIGTGAAVVETINVGGTGANVISIGNSQTGGSLSLGAAMTTGTISIGGTGAHTGNFNLAPGSAAQTVTLASGSGVKTITIGNTTGATTLNLNSGTGGINLGGQLITAGSGIEFTESDTNPTCSSGNYSIYADTSEGKLKKCQNGVASDLNAIPDVNSFTDTTTESVADNDTTNYWDGTAPNITPKSTGSEILVMMTANITGTSNTDTQISAQIMRHTSAITCQTTGTAVGGQVGIFQGANAGNLSMSSVFVDAPGTASNVQYTLCSDADTESAAGTVARIDFTLFEVNDAADLAEIYSTNDAEITLGDVVSLDPSLKAGVRKSSGVNDKGVIGIVSSKPAMVIGGTSDEGESAVPVALSGRVPVKVITENGAIEPGDYLTPSSQPGIAMKSNGRGPVIGQAMSAFNSEGIGVVVVFVKNFDLGTIGEGGVVLTEAELEALVGELHSEAARDPLTVITNRVVEGKQLLTDLVATRLTALRAYIDELFTKKIHTEELCVKKANGDEVCLTGDELESLGGKIESLPEPLTPPEVEPEPESDPEPEPEPEPQPEPAVEIVPEPNPEPEMITPSPIEDPQPVEEVLPTEPQS